jgi:hypothetical protein
MTMSLVAPLPGSEPKLTDADTLESLRQDAITYYLASFKETARRLAVLGVLSVRFCWPSVGLTQMNCSPMSVHPVRLRRHPTRGGARPMSNSTCTCPTI